MLASVFSLLFSVAKSLQRWWTYYVWASCNKKNYGELNAIRKIIYDMVYKITIPQLELE